MQNGGLPYRFDLIAAQLRLRCEKLVQANLSFHRSAAAFGHLPHSGYSGARARDGGPRGHLFSNGRCDADD